MYNFCPKCGTKLVTKKIKNVPRRVCPKSGCGFIFWNSDSISAGGIVTKGDKFLLVQRAENPGRGHWTIPGGFTEQHELLQDSIEREIFEETGIKTQAQGIVLVCERALESPHNIYSIFEMKYRFGTPKHDSEEVQNSGWFTRAEMNHMDVAQLTLEMIDLYRKHQNHPLALEKLPLKTMSNFRIYG